MPEISALEIHFGSFTLEIQQSICVWLGLCILFSIFFIVAGKKIERADPTMASKGIDTNDACIKSYWPDRPAKSHQ